MTAAPEVPATGRGIRDARRVERMTALLLEYGDSPAPNWTAGAVCRKADPDLFALQDADAASWTHDVAELNRRNHEEAVAEYCDWCPVRKDCLAHALRTRERGTWGGQMFTEADHVAAYTARKKLLGKAGQ